MIGYETLGVVSAGLAVKEIRSGCLFAWRVS